MQIIFQDPHAALNPAMTIGQSIADPLVIHEEAKEAAKPLQTALEEIHFLYGDKADALMHALRHLLGKARLTEMETKVLLGLARQIHWYVENHPRKS